LLLRDFGPYGIIFMDNIYECFITVAIVMLLRKFGSYFLSTLVGDNSLLRDFGPYGIIFMVFCVCLLLETFPMPYLIIILYLSTEINFNVHFVTTNQRKHVPYTSVDTPVNEVK
jgi:hypothetical protein